MGQHVPVEEVVAGPVRQGKEVILDDHTKEQHAAEQDDPFPGLWIQQVGNSTLKLGDARLLTQHQTDRLIAVELWSYVAFKHKDQFEAIAGRPDGLDLEIDAKPIRANMQRGGIHSEPIVRGWAFRAWGNRDRDWWSPASGRDFYETHMRLVPGDPAPFDGHREHRLISTTTNIRSSEELECGRFVCECSHAWYMRPR